MGAVNYSSNDYITMGLKPYGPESFAGENGNIDYEEMESCYESDRENAEFIIEKYGFYYFHIATKPGYKAAAKAMRADVAETPTFRQYCA